MGGWCVCRASQDLSRFIADIVSRLSVIDKSSRPRLYRDGAFTRLRPEAPPFKLVKACDKLDYVSKKTFHLQCGLTYSKLNGLPKDINCRSENKISNKTQA